MPLPSLRVVRLTCVDSSVSATPAPATTAPVESVTVPWTLAVPAIWARVAHGARTRTVRASKEIRNPVCLVEYLTDFAACSVLVFCIVAS